MAFDQAHVDELDVHSERRAINRGFGDGMARAIEIVATPALFGVLGWLLDGWLDLFPYLTVALLVFGIVGVFVKLYMGYESEMKIHDQTRRAASDARRSARSNTIAEADTFGEAAPTP